MEIKLIFAHLVHNLNKRFTNLNSKNERGDAYAFYCCNTIILIKFIERIVFNTKKIMDYERFKQKLMEILTTMIPTEATLHLQSVTKNNQVHLDGLAILSPNSNISPTIYLNYYYDDFLIQFHLLEEEETKIQELKLQEYFVTIATTILKIHNENLPTENFSVSFFKDFEKIRSKIVFKLVNYEKNRDLLRGIPHIPYLDLAIVFLCFLDSQFGQNATILITNEHMKLWKVQDRELYEIAILNTPCLLPEEFCTMETLIENLLDITDFPNSSELKNNLLPDKNGSMYVLSNHSKLFGASCILYQNLLKKISEHFSSSLYILPSSIHEVIIIPSNDCSSLSQFTQMVQEVNETQLSAEEILSDHAYYYDGTKKAILYL